jgi:RimJ/RimL family protein N-acetyltransferase
VLELETPRLQFRRFTPDDLHALASIRSDPDVMKYIGTGRTESIDEVQAKLAKVTAHWEQHGFGYWALIEKASSKLAGWCGLSYLEDTEDIEIGYGLAKAYWAKGLATEAAAAVIKYGFVQLRLERIVAVAYPQNIPSQVIMKKLGMKYVKTARFTGGEWVYYGIDRKEYQAVQNWGAHT